jgi:hypothetical protein
MQLWSRALASGYSDVSNPSGDAGLEGLQKALHGISDALSISPDQPVHP